MFQVVMWSQFSLDNAYQLWYEDSTTGILKNKLNGYCLTTTPREQCLARKLEMNSNQNAGQ